VIGGGTKQLAEGLVKKHGAKTYFAVMTGGNADVSGQTDRQTSVSWHDIPEEIGVNYLSTFEAAGDGTFAQQQRVVAVRSKAAASNRQKIWAAAKALKRAVLPGSE
jgi:hypothetical protein